MIRRMMAMLGLATLAGAAAGVPDKVVPLRLDDEEVYEGRPRNVVRKTTPKQRYNLKKARRVMGRASRRRNRQPDLSRRRARRYLRARKLKEAA